MSVSIIIANCGESSAVPTTTPTLRADGSPSDYTLEFGDDFDGATLDRTKWCTRMAYPGGPALEIADATCTMYGLGTLDFYNDEVQRYRDYGNDGVTPLHKMSGSILSLTADTPVGGTYKSAMIRSKATFRPSASKWYYFTARYRLPNTLGTWPADWLISSLNPDGSGGPTPPEIDRMEGALNGGNVASGFVAGGTDRDTMIHSAGKVQTWVTPKPFPTTLGLNTGYNLNNPFSPPQWFTSPNYQVDYGNIHSATSLRGIYITIGTHWTEKSTAYFMDGAMTHGEITEWKDNSQVLCNPAHWIFNFAIGGGWAGLNGVGAQFPCSFDIDFARVYSKTPTADDIARRDRVMADRIGTPF